MAKTSELFRTILDPYFQGKREQLNAQIKQKDAAHNSMLSLMKTYDPTSVEAAYTDPNNPDFSKLIKPESKEERQNRLFNAFLSSGKEATPENMLSAGLYGDNPKSYIDDKAAAESRKRLDQQFEEQKKQHEIANKMAEKNYDLAYKRYKKDLADAKSSPDGKLKPSSALLAELFGIEIELDSKIKTAEKDAEKSLDIYGISPTNQYDTADLSRKKGLIHNLIPMVEKGFPADSLNPFIEQIGGAEGGRIAELVNPRGMYNNVESNKLSNYAQQFPVLGAMGLNTDKEIADFFLNPSLTQEDAQTLRSQMTIDEKQALNSILRQYARP